MKNYFLLLCIFAFSQLNSQVTISLDPTVEYQTIEGFGAHGSMNVWWSGGPFYNTAFLNLMVDDLGLTINRNEYYPDGGDFDAKQKDWIIALKNKAAASSEPIKFITTYWSPPARWKTNNSTVNGGSLKSAYYNDFADYCVNTINEYKTKCGVDLYALSIANEPSFEEFYNSSIWEPEQYSEVISIVGKAIDDAGLSTKNFGVEDMGKYSTENPWLTAILDNSFESRQYMDIWAVHGYLDGINADNGNATGWADMYDRVHMYNKELWMTETSGYDNNWPGGAFDLVNSMYLALEYGNISAWVWWQLGENDASEFNLVNNGSPTKKYFSSKQFYRYIRPGAKHIKSSSSDVDVLVTSFKHPEDGRLTVVLINNSTGSKTVDIDMGSYTEPGSFNVYRTSSSEDCIDAGTVSSTGISLPPQSISTLVYVSTNHGPNVDLVDDNILLNSAGQQTVNLTGIDDGGDGSQTISISAVSSDSTVIPNPTITYTSPNTTATLNYTPQAGKSGDVVISVLLSDNGSAVGDMNEKRISFNVKVIPFVNIAPTIDPVSDFTVPLDPVMKSVEFTGISDGNDGSQIISVTATSPVPQALEVAAIYTPGSDKITFYYVAKIEYPIPVTLTLVDDGGVDLGGENTTTITFTVDIKAGYVTPPVNSISSVNSGIIIYPNPATEYLNINSNGIEFNQVRITDNIGRTMLLENSKENLNSTQLDIKGIEEGLYFIQLFNNSNLVDTRQFVKE